MKRVAGVAVLGLGLLAGATGWAQGGPNGAPPTTTQLFHATGPLPSYEVATIKKPAPDAGGAGGGMLAMGFGPGGSVTMKNYILSAYGSSALSQWQVVGGPEWIGSELYAIQGKPSGDLRDAMQKMTPQDQLNESRMLQQSLLAERFKLKVHFETREMALYELAPAKGGLKVKEVAAPPPLSTAGVGGPPPPPDGKMHPGTVMLRSQDGATVLNARATTMRQLIGLLRQVAEVGGKPIVDKTGFAGNFDVVDLQFAGVMGPAGGSGPGAAETSAPSLFSAIEETLGLKLVPAKGPVEVIVIDSIERPTEN